MFTESNTVEAYLRDLLTGPVKEAVQGVVSESEPVYIVGRATKGVGWRYVSQQKLLRQSNEVFVESYLRDALIHLNPEIKAQPDRADEVLYKLRAIVLSVRSDGLIRANEEMTAWLRGERTMPFGQNNEHVPVRLIDFDNLDNNQFVVTQQYTYRAGQIESGPT